MSHLNTSTPPLQLLSDSGLSVDRGAGRRRQVSNTGRPISHALNLAMARLLTAAARQRDRSARREKRRSSATHNNNNDAHYYSLKLACKQRKERLLLPGANEEPAGGGARVMFLQVATLTASATSQTKRSV